MRVNLCFEKRSRVSGKTNRKTNDKYIASFKETNLGGKARLTITRSGVKARTVGEKLAQSCGAASADRIRNLPHAVACLQFFKPTISEHTHRALSMRQPSLESGSERTFWPSGNERLVNDVIVGCR